MGPLTDDPDALTVAELAEKFGVGENVARRFARRAVQQGKATQTLKRGTRGPAAAYKFDTPPTKG